MKRKRLNSILLASAFAVLLISPAKTWAQKGNKPGGGGGSAAYTIVPFMPPGSTSTASRVSDINDQGQSVGHLTFADGSVRPTHLDVSSGTYAILQADNNAVAEGINNLNQIVGADDITGLYWGSPTDIPVVLPTLEGDVRAWANRINDDGVVIGSSLGLVDNLFVSTCVVWRVYLDENEIFRIDGPIAVPSLFVGADNWAADVNEVVDGATQILVNSGVEPVVWTTELNADGTLGTPTAPILVGTLGLQSPSWSYGYGINNFSDVCGFSDSLPFVASGGQQPHALSVPRDTFHAVAWDVNDSGDSVGYAEVKIKGYTNSPGRKYAYLWKDGQRIDLAKQIAQNSGWDRLSQAFVINANGLIGGQGHFDVQNRGFILIPNAH